MNTFLFRKSRKAVLLLSIFLLVVGGGCSTKSTPQAGIFELDDDTVLVRGKAVRVKVDYMIVKYAREKHLRLKTSENMIIEGFPSLWAIETEQPVKINYRVEDDENIMISITRMMNLGC